MDTIQEATASKSAGSIHFAIGKVEAITPEGNRRVLQAGDVVYPNETVITGADGFIHIDLFDGQVLELSNNDEFSFTAFYQNFLPDDAEIEIEAEQFELPPVPDTPLPATGQPDSQVNSGFGSQTILDLSGIQVDPEAGFDTFEPEAAIEDSTDFTGNELLSLDENDAPQAADDIRSLSEGGALSVNRLNGVINSNDIDSDGDILFVTGISVGGVEGVVGQPMVGTYGTLIVNADGSYDYIVNQDSASALGTDDVGNEVFTYTVSDGRGGSDSAEIIFQISGLNDKPVLLTDSGSANEGPSKLAYTENDGARVIDSTLTLSDVDDTHLESATVTISGNYQTGEDLLSLEAGALVDKVEIRFDAGTLTISAKHAGTVTRAEFEQLLEKVTYENLSDNPNTGDRTISWVVNDGTADSTVVTSTIEVTAGNDKPVLQTNSGTVNEDPSKLAYTENDGASVIDSTLALSDVDDTHLESATVTISGNYQTGEDLLSLEAGALADKVGISFDADTGTLTISAKQAGTVTTEEFEQLLEQVKYSNSSEDPNTANRTISWVVNDGTADSTAVTSTIEITAANDRPILMTGTAQETSLLQYTENDGARVIDSTLALSDVDDTHLESATVTISGNYQSGEDLLSLEAGALADKVGISFDADTGTLTISAKQAGTVTTAEFEQLLEQVKYSNSSEDPNTANRTISWVVNDGTADSTAVTSTIEVTAANDRPILMTGTAQETSLLQYTENDGARVIDSTLTLSDVDDTHLESATVTISGNYRSGEDLLSLEAGALVDKVEIRFDAGTLTISAKHAGTVTRAEFEQLLEKVTYENLSDNPNTGDRTISWVVNDGTADSTVVTSTIEVTAGNDKPVLQTNSGTVNEGPSKLAYTENDGARVIDSTLALSDVDDTHLESATVTISGNYQTGEDLLSLEAGALADKVGISFDADTGTLTISAKQAGTVTTEEFEQLLEQVKYSNSSEDPNTANRTISWVVNDGTADSTAVTSTIEITAANDRPILMTGTAQETSLLQYTENDGASVIDSTLALSDVDDTHLESATVTISGNYQTGEDLLSLEAGALADKVGISFDADTGTLTISAKQAGTVTTEEFEQLLEQVKYSNSSEDPNTANRTISWVVNDGTADSTAVTSTIEVTAANDRPILMTGTAQETSLLQYTENDGARVIDSTLALSDVDDTHLESATVTISGNYQTGEDLLSLEAGALADKVEIRFDAGTLTISAKHAGTVTRAEFEQLLEKVTYENLSDNPNTGDRTISWVVNDGTADSTVVTSTIEVTAGNDKPVLQTNSGTVNEGPSKLAYTENDGARVIDSTLALSDVDDTHLESATVTISGNYQTGEDLLSLEAGALADKVGISFDADTGTLTISAKQAGTVTTEEFEQLLEQVKYSNSSEDPNTANRTISWVVNDGTADSTAVTSTIEITAANDRPILMTGTAQETSLLQYTENDGASVIDSTLALSDVDDTHLESATVTISGNYQTGEDLLSLEAGALADKVGISFDADTGTLTISAKQAGTVTTAEFEQLLEQVKYSNSSEDPNTANRTISWVVNDGTADSTAVTSTIEVTAANDRPILMTGTAQETSLLQYTENDGARVIDSTLTLSDVDDTHLESATVTISGNYRSGEDLLSLEAGALVDKVEIRFDAGTLTISAKHAGTVTRAEFEQLLEKVTYENLSDNPNTGGPDHQLGGE
ncbi:Ig-like domain-containing protein [Endozoicomonas sp. GU-1]|uniref:Ig-like domain-containing protein n=1 Tax=Endozoicomonas sp. GU-1 TaxID=3009078 RepID=UPI0022B461FB|nr:Ig-like domain-containing protein [Endozoicomonas sp. GU-1]WBA81836.1 Ig-like domain-containing protein [Endozoicomonas sp. GU-1]